jgi:hypothetical protein
MDALHDLLQRTIVWDNHSCMPLRPGDVFFLPQLERAQVRHRRRFTECQLRAARPSYSLNRLNVATSRAMCLCVVVGSPTLFEPECRIPRQMQMANAFCRYLEMAEEI